MQINPQKKNTSPLTGQFSFERWRKSYIQKILYGCLAAGLLTAILASIDLIKNATGVQRTILPLVYLGSWLLLLVITLIREPYWLRVAFFVSIFYCLGVSSLFETGVRGDSCLLFFTFVILLAMLFSPKAGFFGAGLTMLTIGFSAWLLFTGRVQLMSTIITVGSITMWIVSSIELLFVEVVVLIGLTLFLREFQLAQTHIDKNLTDLSNERALLRTLIDSIPDLIYTSDVKGEKTITNKAFQNFKESPLTVEENNETDIIVLKTGQPLINHEKWMVNQTQTQFWMMSSKIPFYDKEGNVIGLVGVSRDITERKIAEEKINQLNIDLNNRVRERTSQLEFANIELEAFNYSVSHDLQAPLRAINGFSEILANGYNDKLDEEGNRYLNNILTASIQMSQMIDALFNLSRVNKSEVKRQSNKISDDLIEITKSLHQHHPNHNPVQWDIEPNLVVNGDATLVHIVFENLMSNAFKFTGRREVGKIKIGVNEQNGERIYFVQDNGIGFDMTKVSQLFKPFSRLHNRIDFAGTGIGLTTVRRIISRHGGRIWVESKINVGTTFYFTFA